MKYLNNIKYLFLGLSVMVFTACDSEEFLNPVPTTAISADAYFETDADVLTGITGIYDALQGVNENTEGSNSDFNRGIQFEYLLTEHRSDNTRSATLEGSRADFHRYVADANNIQSEDYYQSMYEIIFRANTVLSFVDAADDENRTNYIAEAKFLRAYAYFNLVRLYGSDDDAIGSVPLVTAVAEANDDQLLFTRVPKSRVYAQIVEDLQQAVDALDNSYKARASRGAAQGLLAKVLLSQPSPDPSRAQRLCEDVISEGAFSLEPNFRDVFYDELNDEVMFAIRYEFQNENESQGFSSEFTSFNNQGRQDGLNIVNPNLVAAFNLNGGNRTEVSYQAFGGDAELFDIVSGLAIPQEAEVAKFLPDGSDLSDSNLPTYGSLPRQAGNDWIVLRYADVLLLHVEATIALAGTVSTDDAGAVGSFNAVRNRAGLPNDVDGVITVEELLLERRVELAFENQRFFDLLRFGVADTVLQNHSAEDNDEDITVYPSYNARKLLLPIPSRERNLSKGLLSQNPGY